MLAAAAAKEPRNISSSRRVVNVETAPTILICYCYCLFLRPIFTTGALNFSDYCCCYNSAQLHFPVLEFLVLKLMDENLRNARRVVKSLEDQQMQKKWSRHHQEQIH